MKDKFLTAKGAVKKLEIPLSTLYRLSNQGRIKSMHIGGRWYFPESEIDKYLSCELVSAVRRYNNPPERRNNPRINCHIDCGYSIDLPGRTNSHAVIKYPTTKPRSILLRKELDALSSSGQAPRYSRAVIKNLSAGGMFITDNGSDILPDDPLKVSFVLENKIEIRADARIVRKMEKGFGLKFRNIKNEYKDAIEKYIG